MKTQVTVTPGQKHAIEHPQFDTWVQIAATMGRFKRDPE